MNKKILIIIPTPLAFKQFLSEVSLKLSESGFKLHVACTYYENFSYEKHIKYHFIDIDREVGITKTFRARKQLINLVKDISPEYIHAHFSSSCFLLAISKQSYFPKCYATIQGALSTSSELGFKKNIYKIFETYALKKMDKAFVLTDDDYTLLKPIVANLYLQTAKGFGVNLDRFKINSNFDRTSLKASLGIGESDFVMIYIGRLVNFKGFNLTLKIFNELHIKHPNSKLIVCGVEDKIRGLQFDEIEENIWQKNSSIIKIGFTNELEKFLAISDINIFPSRREGLPVNLMESIASEVPCIVSNYRGCRHVIINKINGIVVDRYDIKSFVKEIENLITKPSMLQKLKVGCRKTRFLYDRNLYFEELTELYST